MLTHYLHTVRQFNRDVRLYLVASVLLGFTLFGGIYSLLFNLYLLRMGYGPKFVGLVNATGALSFAVFSLPAGILGGRWGSRRALIAGICVCVIGHGLLSQAMVISPPLRESFILATYSFGLLGVALYFVNGTPYLMGIAGEKERTHVFSMHAALLPLSGFAGSLVGGFLPGRLAAVLDVSLDHPAAYRHTLCIAALLLLPAVIALLATRDARATHRQETLSEAAPLPLGLIALISLVSLLHVAGEGAVRTFFNIYLDDSLNGSLSLIGVLLAAGQLLAVPAALAMPLFSARFGNRPTVIGCALGIAIVLVPLAYTPHWGVAGLCFMSMTALTSIRRPAFIVFQQELVPTRWRTAMSGASAMMSGLGYSAMALGGGYIIATAGYPSLFLTGTLATAAGTMIFWATFRRPRGEFARQAAQDQMDLHR